MIKLCWHKWTKWSDPVQTYRSSLQQWKVCEKCNKASFRNLSWHQQTALTTIIQAIAKAKGE
jgi:hypothetical protein